MLKGIKSLYFIGIGGISMSALARIYHDRGIEIYGSDLHSSALIEELRQEGMEIIIGAKSPKFVKACDAVVYTSAIDGKNADIRLAKRLNKPCFSRAEVLGDLSMAKKTISIAGTHGKTTTTGMIANCLMLAGNDPTIHIGGILKNINSNLHIGKGHFFVTEACEYKDSFLMLKNYVSIVLNVEEDHLDYFKTRENVFKSFNKFIKNTSKNGAVVYNFDQKDPKLKIPTNCISFGLKDGADVQAKNIKSKRGKYSFVLFYKNNKQGRIYLNCYGKHNIYNALATCAACIFLGLSFKQTKSGLETFNGIERRFDVISDEKALILHDYAHHPHEIECSLKACKDISKKSKIITIFQPHTYTRTRDLYNDFLKCFSLSDEVWLLPIYPAREEPIKNITSLNLATDLIKNGNKSVYFEDFDSCKKAILENNKKNNIIAILGAGDIYKLAQMLKK